MGKAGLTDIDTGVRICERGEITAWECDRPGVPGEPRLPIRSKFDLSEIGSRSGISKRRRSAPSCASLFR